MRSVRRTVGPLLVYLSLIAASAACSGDGGGEPASATSAGPSLASSSAPAGASSAGATAPRVPVGPSEPRPARGSVEVVRTLAHDPTLFTQGLQVVGGEIYESTGRYGGFVGERRPPHGGGAVAWEMEDDELGGGLVGTPPTVL